MSVTLLGPNGFFPRAAEYVAQAIAAEAIFTRVADEIEAQRARYSRRHQDEIDFTASSLREQAANELSRTLGRLSAKASRLLVDMVDDDADIAEKTVAAAAKELVAQMASASASVKRSVVSISASADAGNDGNGTAIVSGKDLDDVDTQTMREERITLECIRASTEVDDQSLVLFQAKGETARGSLSAEGPGGSSANLLVRQTVGETDGGSRAGSNQLNRADMEDFTSNKPDGWTQEVGSAGTHYDANTTSGRGTYALRFIGNGSTLTKLSQTFNTTSATAGTPAKLIPRMRYAHGLLARKDGAGPTGIARFALTDSGGSVLYSSSITLDVSALTTSFVRSSVSFVTPYFPPSGAKYVSELTTAVNASNYLLCDDFIFAPMYQLYRGGPWVIVAAGTTGFAREDKLYIDVSYTSKGLFGYWLSRLLGLGQLNIALPSASSPTIDDSIIPT